jgi:hypothetical protein
VLAGEISNRFAVQRLKAIILTRARTPCALALPQGIRSASTITGRCKFHSWV